MFCLWKEDLERRQQQGELRADSARRYLSWGHRAVQWGYEHLRLPNSRARLLWLMDLAPDRQRLLEWLRAHGSQAERNHVQQFLQWLDAEGYLLDDLPSQGEEWTRRFAHDYWEATGLKTWRQGYSTTRRGLRKLQQAGLLEDFPLYYLTRFYEAYSIPWQEIPHAEIRQQAATYHRVACDESAFAERTGRTVTTYTRNNNLTSLRRFIGFLIHTQQLDVATMDIDVLFSRPNLKAFAAFLIERREGKVTEGTKITIGYLRHISGLLLGIPEERFKRLFDADKIELSRKADRVPTLDEYHALMEGLRQAALKPENKRMSQQQGALARLHCMLVILAACPLRARTLCQMRLEDNLYKDPITGVWWLRFSAEDAKQKRPFQCPLPEETYPVIEHFIERIHPLILQGKETRFLFPTMSGRPVDRGFFDHSLAYWDHQIRGVPLEKTITPHRVRDMASHTCVVYLPDKGGLVASTLLQHASIKTLDEYYLGEGARTAIQRNERLYRWVSKKEMGREEVRKVVDELRRDKHEWRRFKKALVAIEGAAQP
ncbi:MAG: site-specific integrase [Gemmatimonadetes bacterium]|nr:site-specific integrase [Gemmatimonadota bacterium]